MRFAVIYSGYLGNLRRSFNSLRKNLFVDSDEVDVYIVTKDISNNVVKFMDKKTLKGIVYTKVNGYTIESIKEAIGYPIASLTEWAKDPELQKEYSIEVEKFLDRTRNYEYEIPRVLNYDKEKRVFPTPSIGSIFEQFFMVNIGIKKIQSSGKSYDFIIRFRDRVTLSSKIPRSFLNPDKIFLLGWKSDIYICEAFVICSENKMSILFSDYHKKIGGFRSAKVSDPKNHTDNTFSGECQFALRLYSEFKDDDLFFSKYVVRHEVVSYKDRGYGPSITSSEMTDDMDECEWKIYNTSMTLPE